MSDQPPTVTTALGAVRGFRDDGVDCYRGIPYARPPVGELRFQPPQPPALWEGVVQATEFGPISLQDVDPLPMAVPGAESAFYRPGTTTGEDCLSLNIWAPAGPGPHPVLFWIHGGAFLCGSGSGEWIDGASFARRGVMVVTINYRLGVLGWTDLRQVIPDAVNLGLRDQIAALQWVHNHIAAFGGDPNRVTIAGESAGAMSTCALLACNEAEGLFARAI
ncbi:MAG: carboxylesterase family protein, partial [Bifidobacteriaceae bacterium]|nr:carboxylesterase family protein [Bifidobacteriaceae bacterium]